MTGGAVADGYMCSVCGYSVLHSHPEQLIECHDCALWFHRACVNVSHASQLLKYACFACTSKQGTTAFLPHHDDDDDVGAMTGFYDSVDYSNSRYTTTKRTSSISQSQLYRKNADGFRHVLKTGFYAKTGVRVLQAQVRRSSLPSRPSHLDAFLGLSFDGTRLLKGLCDVVRLFVYAKWQEFTRSYFKAHPPSCEDPMLVQSNSHGVAGLRDPFPVLGVSEITSLLAQNNCAMRSVDVESQESFNLSTTGWNARLGNQKATPVNAQFRVHATRFQNQVAAPIAVSEVDWRYMVSNQNASSSSSSPGGSKSPQQGSNPDIFGSYFGANSFQDFTVTPGGKCSWLSVSDGDAWVFLIPPTRDNLRGFQDWRRSSEPAPARVFLAEHVDSCIKCVVSKSSTLFIPSGWMYAVFSEQGCSFFMGFFSMTVSLCSQVRVLEMEAASDHIAHTLQETLSAGWKLEDAVPQLWAALCVYVRRFLIPEPSVHVGEEEKHALVRALPYLRRWSSSPKAIKSRDGVSWTPASLAEAQDILDRLEQALNTVMVVTPLRAMESSHFDLNHQHRFPVDASMSRQQQQMSPSEAEYLYSRGDSGASMTWPAAPEHTTPPSVSGFQDLHSMWNYAGEHNPLSSHPYYHPHLDSEYASSQLSSQQPNYTFSLPAQGAGYPAAPHGGLGATGDTYMESMRQQLFSSSLPTPGLVAQHQQQHQFDGSTSTSYSDQLVRHRASCHRCGNLRKKNVRCPQCPHIFCQKCAEKMLEEHGETIFVDGCPVCKEQCCCGKNRTILCTRKVSLFGSYVCIAVGGSGRLMMSSLSLCIACLVPLLQEMSVNQETVRVSVLCSFVVVTNLFPRRRKKKSPSHHRRQEGRTN